MVAIRYSILLFLFLTSCGYGLKKVIVPNLSYIVADRTGDQLDLYYSQEKKFKKELEELFKREMDQVKKLRTVVQDISLETSKADKVLEDTILIFRGTLTKFNIILAKYTASLSKDQQKRFFKIQKENNEKIEERLKEEDLDKIIERYEFFFGDLNKSQLKMIKSEKHIFMDLISKRLVRRTTSQDKIKAFFKQEDKQKIESSILNLYNKNLVEGQDQARTGKSMVILKNLLASLTTEQKKYFKEKQKMIVEWIDEFIKVYSAKES